MKKIKNMNIVEIQNAWDKYTVKCPATDDFKIQNLHLCEYSESIKTAVQTGNNETIQQIISDIFYHGFMNGAKQNEKKSKDKYNKVFNVHSEQQHHKDLVELAYNLPFGIGADYFYTFMVLMLNNKFEGVAEMLPAKQKKIFYETVNRSEERKHRKDKITQEVEENNKCEKNVFDIRGNLNERGC